MSKTHKIIYAVNAEKKSMVMIKETDKVVDVLSKIQKKEGDDKYKYIFFEGSQIDNDDIFFEYYEPTIIYIVTKTSKVPKDLDCWLKTVKSDLDEDPPTIGEEDAINFEFSKPEDLVSDVLPSSDSEEDIEIPDLKKGSGISEPKVKKPAVVKTKKTSSGQRYRVFTTLTLSSMLKGNLLEGIDEKMEVNDIKSVVLKWVQNEKSFKSVIDDKNNLEVHLFLPCGAPFLSGTIHEWKTCLDTYIYKILYAVVTRKLRDNALKIYKHICDCSNDEMKLLLSPICDSTEEGYTQIASLLGFFYYGGSLPLAENLLHNLATMTGFAPMINSIYTIMIQKKVTGMMIASITAPFQTFITENVNGSNLRTAFSYTISLMSYVNSTIIKNLPLPNLITYQYKNDDDKLNTIQIYMKEHGLLNFIVLWDKDFIMDENDVFKVSKLPAPVKIKQLNDCFKSEMSLKPVSPMTILYLSSVSFIKTSKTKVGIFIRKKPERGKERNILFIDPENGGEPEEIDYEDLADRVGDDSIDENIKNKGDTSLQQIIYVCLDTSFSMRNLLNGSVKKTKTDGPSRKELSIIFLKALMKRIHDYMIPTARGLILFGDEIDVKCPLSIEEKDFNKAVEDIRPYGSTLLWKAVDKAADEIIKFNPYKTVDGERQYKYPKARGRIILLSDADDNEAESDEMYEITEKLVQNGIMMDVIMISTAEECRDALVSAKITSGLSFRPENEEQGIELFENEAFIDINTRSNFIPIEDKITDVLFTQQNRRLGRNPYAKDIESKCIKQATVKAELSSVDYTLFYRDDERYQPKSICDRIIIKQLNRIKKKADPDIVVYTFQKDLRKWRVFIKGAERTPYEGSWWNLYVNFPENYPNSPPKFRFVSIPYHQNVSGEGLLLFGQIVDLYDPGHKMPSLLKKIRNLFKKPDDLYLLRESIAKERVEDDAGFTRKAQDSKNAGAKADYHDFIRDVKVNEEVPEGGILEEEGGEVNDSQFMTVTHKGGRIISSSDSDDEHCLE